MLGRSHLLSASSIFPETRQPGSQFWAFSAISLTAHHRGVLANWQAGVQKLGLLCIAHSPADLPSPCSQPPTGSLLLWCSSKAQLSHPIWKPFLTPKWHQPLSLLFCFPMWPIFVILSCCLVYVCLLTLQLLEELYFYFSTSWVQGTMPST